MPMFDAMGRAGAAIRRARARRKAVRMLDNLPADIQKDIGWPVSGHAGQEQELFNAIWNAAR
jgi:hypothetical protein